jgi:UDP-GlcNAc:undecaprenyl-phosphate/decaprenyl-phosphate GlcNAc-1-phosphate transferase
MDWLPAGIVVCAFALSALLTFLAGKLGERAGMVDQPGGRRLHSRPVSRLGGLGLAAAFLIVALGLVLWPPLRPEPFRPIVGVLGGALFVCLCGLADDKFQFKSGPQFAIQFGAALIAIAGTVWIQEVTLPFLGLKRFDWYITYPLTIVWVMGMMNTVNFLDGLDGLAAGVGAIAALLFALHSFQLEQYQIALYSLALAGACLGFLCFNFHPARVFLGSAGAMTLGYALATLSILAPARVATALLVMVIPIADTAFQIFDRWRHGRSPLQGDRGHLHFRLFDLGLSQRQIVIGYWVLCAVFGLAALVIPRIYKLPALGLLGLIVVGVLRWLTTQAKPPAPPPGP